MIWIWLGVVVSLILTEFLSRNFTAICFVISGIISCILTQYTNNYMIQLGEFLVVGILLISFVRPLVLKWLKKRTKENSVNNKKRKENKNKK